MIVLLEKQVHLQKEVGAVMAQRRYGLAWGCFLKREPDLGPDNTHCRRIQRK